MAQKFIQKSALYLITMVAVSAPFLTPTVAMAETSTTAASETRIAELKTRANQEIDRRVAKLQELTKTLDQTKKLSGDEKSHLKTEVQSEIAILTALKSKIAADTDLTVLKADVKTIVDSYRVFALFIPQIHIIAASDVMDATTDKLLANVTKIQSAIDKLKSAGKDVTAAQNLLNDATAKLNDAKTQYTNAKSTVTPLQPAGYPGNKPTLESARNMIKAGREDLKAVRDDMKKISDILKSLRGNTNSAT